MAIKLQDKPNVEAPSVAYPFENIKDNSGAGDGTPANKIVYADFHQFFAKVLFESGLVANGLPDNQTNGFQYFDALMSFLGGMRRKVIPIGTWNMDTDSTKNVPHGLGNLYSTPHSIRVTIRSDDEGLVDQSTHDILASGNAVVSGPAETPNFVILTRSNGGIFDGSNHDKVAGGYNRGWIIIDYVPIV